MGTSNTSNLGFPKSDDNNLNENSTNKENLSFNEDADSYEIDVRSDDPDYDHPDPYNTAVKNGGDIDSSYDEANPTAVDEYEEDEDEQLDISMRLADDDILKVKREDQLLSRTPEDDLDDLDEEGYPKND